MRPWRFGRRALAVTMAAGACRAGGPDRPVVLGPPGQTGWCDAIGRAVRQAGGEQSFVLVAHNLGCLAAAVWLADHPRSSVAGAFLVAPPDRGGPRFPPVTGFDGPLAPLPVPAAVAVASSDNLYCDQSVADALADVWGAALIQLGPADHINTASAPATGPRVSACCEHSLLAPFWPTTGSCGNGSPLTSKDQGSASGQSPHLAPATPRQYFGGLCVRPKKFRITKRRREDGCHHGT